MSWREAAAAAISATGRALGDVIEYRRGAVVVTIRAPFSAEGSILTLEDGTRVEVSGPSLGPALSDLPDGMALAGDEFTALGADYRVVEVVPDGHGAARLRAVAL